MTPIRPGTARRLGIRPPMRAFVEAVGYLQRNLEFARRYGVIPYTFLAGDPSCCRAGEQAYPLSCPWHPR